jgi:hypothetical protein
MPEWVSDTKKVSLTWFPLSCTCVAPPWCGWHSVAALTRCRGPALTLLSLHNHKLNHFFCFESPSLLLQQQEQNKTQGVLILWNCKCNQRLRQNVEKLFFLCWLIIIYFILITIHSVHWSSLLFLHPNQSFILLTLYCVPWFGEGLISFMPMWLFKYI